MVFRAKFILLGLMTLLTVNAVASSTAFAESEAPFWSVGGHRLESEQKKEAISKSSKEIIIHGILEKEIEKGTEKVEVEIRCKTVIIGKQEIIGSLKEHDGTQEGVFEFIECKLWAKEGKFVEQTGCEVPNFSTVTLAGRLWLEGKKSEKGTKIVIAFEAKAGGALAEIKIATIKGKTCAFTKGSPYKLEGSFAANLPSEAEGAILKYVFPVTPILHVYQPPAQEAEAELGLKLAGSSASLQGEIDTELMSKESFSSYAVPTWYAEGNKWFVNGKALTGSQVVEGSVGTAQLQSVISNIKIFITCNENKLSEAEIETEGKSKGAITYSNCKVAEIKNGVKTVAEKCKAEIPTFKFKDQLKEGSESGVAEDEFKPSEGTLFVEIKIKGVKVGECGLEGTFKTEGSYIASFDAEGAVEKVEHTLNFTSKGSKVKFGKEKTGLTGVVAVKL
jgi:hypothetical protein